MMDDMKAMLCKAYSWANARVANFGCTTLNRRRISVHDVKQCFDDAIAYLRENGKDAVDRPDRPELLALSHAVRLRFMYDKIGDGKLGDSPQGS